MIEGLYNKNGLVFWTEEDLVKRDYVVSRIKSDLMACLMGMNAAFKSVRVEAPVITPEHLISREYASSGVFKVDDGLFLRPETTAGTYEYAKILLNGYGDVKYKPPIVVWQMGKSFRREQDQPTKFMRLKEFHQLEFQILFSKSTANDYYPGIAKSVLYSIAAITGRGCRTVDSDRIPSYSVQTTDIESILLNMELCSISKRTDYEGLNNIEVAVGVDRVLYAMEHE